MEQDTLCVCKICLKILMSIKVFTGQVNITKGCKSNDVKCAVNANFVLNENRLKR